MCKCVPQRQPVDQPVRVNSISEIDQLHVLLNEVKNAVSLDEFSQWLP